MTTYNHLPMMMMHDLVNQLTEKGRAEPRGKWIIKDGKTFIAIDNEDGYVWTEEFKTRKEAIVWLETGEHK